MYLSDTFRFRISEKMDGLAGKTLAGAFTLFKIGQVTTRPDALNFICITLTPNVKFFSEDDSNNKRISRITIAGLLGSATSVKQITVSACPTSVNAATGLAFAPPNVFLPGGAQPLFKSRESNAESANKHVIDWDQATGTAVLSMDPDNQVGMAQGLRIVFAIPLRCVMLCLHL